jgi:hypothetical protein
MSTEIIYIFQASAALHQQEIAWKIKPWRVDPKKQHPGTIHANFSQISKKVIALHGMYCTPKPKRTYVKIAIKVCAKQQRYQACVLTDCYVCLSDQWIVLVDTKTAASSTAYIDSVSLAKVNGLRLVFRSSFKFTRRHMHMAATSIADPRVGGRLVKCSMINVAERYARGQAARRLRPEPPGTATCLADLPLLAKNCPFPTSTPLVWRNVFARPCAE